MGIIPHQTKKEQTQDQIIKVNKDIPTEKQSPDINQSNEIEIKLDSLEINKKKGDVTDSSSISETESASLNNQSISPAQDLYSFTFIWKEGGNEVSLIGEFSDWDKPYLMKRDASTNYHFIKISLPKAIHQFKFIVDGTPCLSKDYPTMLTKDGYLTNYVDLIKESIHEEDRKRKEKIKAMIKSKKEEEKKRMEFDSYYPTKNEMKKDAANIPFQYLPTFNIDLRSRQSKSEYFKEQKFLNYKENNLLSENNSYKKILMCSHIHLNHLCLSSPFPKDNKILRGCVSQRVRHKVVTLVYYNPNKLL
ncbi:MAG: glycogen-binding domain-containing protein [archaeon]|nr:glycogen-binding domain-containing protein [archaeon]